MKMKTKTVQQSVTFKATAHEVYETLMDSRKHAHFTRAKGADQPEGGREDLRLRRLCRRNKP